MEYGERGSGRTSREIMKLREGDAFVVPNYNSAHAARHAIANLRGKDFSRSVRVVVISGMHSLHRLYGFGGRVLVDHWFWKTAEFGVAEELKRLASACNSRHPADEPAAIAA